MRDMTEAEIHAAALAGPDAQLLTPDFMVYPRPVPRAKILRRAVGLTQGEFAASYQIPLGTLRDWEQGRVAPDQTAHAYLKVIAGNPEAVRQALQASAPPNPPPSMADIPTPPDTRVRDLSWEHE